MTKRFSASSAAQLMQCPGSANLELAIPGFKEPVKDEMAGAKGVGTRLHNCFQPLAKWTPYTLLNLQMIVEDYAALHYRKRRLLLENPTSAETIAWAAQIGGVRRYASHYIDWLVELDREERLPPIMLRYVAETIKELIDLLSKYQPLLGEIHTEESISCYWLEGTPKTTPDIVIAQKARLTVIDYKTGKIPVSPVANDQLLFYAYSALRQYYLMDLTELPPGMIITMIIWQPGNHDKWSCDLATLSKWAEQAMDANTKIIHKDLTLRPGSACTFCPANPHSRGDKAPPYCPAMMAKLYPDTTDEEGILDLD